MTTGQEIYLKSSTDSSQPSCHHLLVGMEGAFQVVVLLSHLDLGQYLTATRSLALPTNSGFWLSCPGSQSHSVTGVL